MIETVFSLCECNITIIIIIIRLCGGEISMCGVVNIVT